MYQSYDLGYGKINAYNAVVKAAHLSGSQSSSNLIRKIWTRSTHETHEVRETVDGVLSTAHFPLPLIGDAGSTSNPSSLGFRFPHIALPSGAIIQKAILQFTAADSDTQLGDVVLMAELGDAKAYHPNAPLLSRTYSNNKILWELTNWQAEQSYNSPNLKTLLQEVVDHPDWHYSGGLAFKLTHNNSTINPSKAIYTYEMAPCQSPQL